MSHTAVFEQIQESFDSLSGEVTQTTTSRVHKSHIEVTDEFFKVSKYLNTIFAYNNIPLSLVPISLLFAQRMQFKKKFNSIREIFRTGKKATIELEGMDLSQLIANSTQTENFADMTDFWIDDDRLMAKMSIPMDMLQHPKIPKMFSSFFRGRYLNGVFKLDFAIKDGNLNLNVDECIVKGNPVNETFLKMLNSQNLDAAISRKLGHAWREYIESIEIKNNKMIIKTK